MSERLPVCALVKILALLDQQYVAFLLLGGVSGTHAEHVGFVATLQVGLEQGGDGTLDVDGVLGVSRLHADAVLYVSVVEVEADGSLDVGDVSEFLEEPQGVDDCDVAILFNLPFR